MSTIVIAGNTIVNLHVRYGKTYHTGEGGDFSETHRYSDKQFLRQLKRYYFNIDLHKFNLTTFYLS